MTIKALRAGQPPGTESRPPAFPLQDHASRLRNRNRLQMNSPLNRLVATTCLAVGLITATIAPTLAQNGHTPLATPPAVTTSWSVLEQRPLEVDGSLAALSPDGRWIAGVAGDRRFCIWDAATLSPTCDTGPLPIDHASIAWAPDSTAVAFTLNTLIEFRESDLFVFELEAGASRNLTDDGIDDIPLGDTSGSSIPVDLYPAWSADSQSLTFARTDYAGDTHPTSLVRIDRAGGEPEVRHAFDPSLAWPIASPMYSLANGSLLFAMSPINPDPPEQGLWRLDANGEVTQYLRGMEADAYPMTVIVDVAETATGTFVSAYSRLDASVFVTGEPFAFVIELDSGDITPLAHPDDATVPLQPGGFSPDGITTLAISVYGPNLDAVTLGAGVTVTTLTEFRTLDIYAVRRAPDWAANNTVLLTGFMGDPILLTMRPIQ
jgi:hypothetical protein